MTKLSTLCREHGVTLGWLAKHIKRSRNTVKKYGQPGRKIPAEVVPDICRAFKGRVSPDQLRPDVFGPLNCASGEAA